MFNCLILGQFQSSFRALRIGISDLLTEKHNVPLHWIGIYGDWMDVSALGKGEMSGRLMSHTLEGVGAEREEGEIAIFSFLFLSFSIDRLTCDETHISQLAFQRLCNFRIINLAGIFAFLSVLLDIFITAIGGGLPVLKAAKLAF